MLKYPHFHFVWAFLVSALLAACGGGVDVAPVEGTDGPPPITLGTVEIELADRAKGTSTRLMLDLGRITGALGGLTDDLGVPLKGVLPADLARICYMSNRTGWNEQASACTNIHPGKRPADFVCYDEYGQPTSCLDAFLGDSGLVVIFRNLRNNDRGELKFKLTAADKWYKLGVKEWPCVGPVSCTETSDYLREYGGYRPAMGTLSCENGIPTARVHFGTDAINSFGPVLKPSDISSLAYWNSDAIGWSSSIGGSGASGSIELDSQGDYVFVVSGLPVKEPKGNFSIRSNKNGEWSWMDPTAFAWSANVVVDRTAYQVGYDLGTCP